MKYKIGIIGYGGFGQFLHHVWGQHEQAEVIAAADQNLDINVKNIVLYSSWQIFLRKSNVDIVSIATPPVTHAEIAVAALKHNKHVLLEKPIATTWDDAQKIRKAKENSESVLMVDYMLRFHPLVEVLKMWISTLTFGKLRRIIIENYAQDESLPRNHWFWDRSQSGGILVEHGVHFIDLVNYLTDSKAAEIKGITNWRNSHQEDQALATVRYENGIIVTHYHDFSRPGFFERTSQTYVFDLGQITLMGWIPLRGRFTLLTNKQSYADLERLPGLKIKQQTEINEIRDDSRPTGWGMIDPAKTRPSGTVRSGGERYEADRIVSGEFSDSRSKGELYSDCLGSVLTDLIKTIENPNHTPRITLKDGLDSLEIALKAE